MSAIFGLFRRDQSPVTPDELQSMSEMLKHRGTDGAHIWANRNVGLGHRMLWTTPESLHEQLPLVDKLSGLTITADARIDNRQELHTLLEIRRPLAEVSDSELILAAYIRWGEQCPDKLLGDFAFAVWDGERLFCARDHFGVKPFYYFASETCFAFATEIKGILCLEQIPRRLNETRIAVHLTLGGEDASMTFYEDIKRLRPAHRITITGQTMAEVCYWALDPLREHQGGSDEEYAEEFQVLFTEAVRCRSRSAFPMGSMLSGGLDSSSITCVARNLLPKDQLLHTFSIVHDVVTECDEREFQDAVLAQGGFDPHYLNNDFVSPLIDLESMLWHQDELVGGNLYSLWCLYRQAGDRNVRVILDGFDGDSTVSHGRGYLTELARAGRWFSLAAEVRAFSKQRQMPWREPYWAWVWNYGLEPRFKSSSLLSGTRRVYRRFLKPSAGTRKNDRIEAYKTFLNPEFARGLTKRQATAPPQTEREMHHSLITDVGMVGLLEMLDRAAGAFGVEIRFPFWDKRLIEFCLALPATQKWHRGTTRMVMRRAMEGILPPKVQWRPRKTNASPAFYHGLRTFEQDRVRQTLLRDYESIERYVNVGALAPVYERFASGEASDNDVLAISKVLSLALWLQSTPLKG